MNGYDYDLQEIYGLVQGKTKEGLVGRVGMGCDVGLARALFFSLGLGVCLGVYLSV